MRESIFNRLFELDLTTSKFTFDYPFGSMYCFDNYVIGQIKEGVTVDTAIATRMLKDIDNYFGKKKIVFISNREFGHQVDPKVYKLVNSKSLIGIAIIGKTPEQKTQAASEQPLYNGSFGYFTKIESAVEWAKSFVHETCTS